MLPILLFISVTFSIYFRVLHYHEHDKVISWVQLLMLSNLGLPLLPFGHAPFRLYPDTQCTLLASSASALNLPTHTHTHSGPFGI